LTRGDDLTIIYYRICIVRHNAESTITICPRCASHDTVANGSVRGEKQVLPLLYTCSLRGGQ